MCNSRSDGVMIVIARTESTDQPRSSILYTLQHGSWIGQMVDAIKPAATAIIMFLSHPQTPCFVRVRPTLFKNHVTPDNSVLSH